MGVMAEIDAGLVEFERYELREGSAYRFDLERRDFFKLLGGGLILFLAFDGLAGAQESGRGGPRGDARPNDLGAWLHIGEDGTISVFTGKTEVGQNIRTSLAQAVAEELHVPISSIQMVMADTALTPYDMGTFGSRTTPTMAPQLRKAGAAAREMLIDLAAERWKVDRSGVSVSDGRVKNGVSGATVSFGELTRGQKIAKTVTGAALTPADRWSVAGTSAMKVNARDIVTGAHRYTSDLTRPGMRYGRVLRSNIMHSKLTALNTEKASGLAGVTIVQDGDFAGAAAEDEEMLAKVMAALDSKWSYKTQPSNQELFGYLKSHADPVGPAPRELEEAIGSATHKLDARYTVQYIAHIPLEPRAALAEWQGGNLTVWTGTQVPFGVRGELAEAFGIPQSQVRVIVPDTGSGYGGKHTGECAIEAARLAKAAGKPVKLVWTREEEFTYAYFRPAGVIEIRSGVSEDGQIQGWEYHNYNSGPSGIAIPYDVLHSRVEFHPSESPLRQGSYRGLAATANHFARESHIDDLAAMAGIDPLEFRLKNLKDARLRAVLQAAADRFGWKSSASSPSRGFGLACGLEKGGYVASGVEVSIAPGGKVKIERVVTAFECGAIVNPEHLKNQVEGAVVMGIGGALFEAIEFKNGRILNGKLSEYRVPRFSDVPVLETVLVDRQDLASAGAGETPIVALAPAVGNAIFHATGRRIRQLPMIPSGLPA
jgi:CO/xanthine dehydrogenase Mo-binding subunit